MTEKRTTDTEGRQLFDQFLRSNGVTGADAARALETSEVAILHWRTGERRPVDHWRAKIEVWTGGKVPALTWRTLEERAEIEAIQPFAAVAS